MIAIIILLIIGIVQPTVPTITADCHSAIIQWEDAPTILNYGAAQVSDGNTLNTYLLKYGGKIGTIETWYTTFNLLSGSYSARAWLWGEDGRRYWAEPTDIFSCGKIWIPMINK